MNTPEKDESLPNFVRERIADDVQAGRTRVCTRFPPEPNGYLHVGHAKSICLNFTMAQEFGGVCHLRFDDTNPETEETEYVESIQEDIRWLGFDWGDNQFYASDYFEQLYAFAVQLVKAGKAYVDSQSPDEIRSGRGDFHKPGTDSPHRDRSAEENLDLLQRMKDGEFDEGEHVLRAKIDMASPNLNLRDPLMYRIRKVDHHRTGDAWCIYPMYDYAHGQSDAIERITHSICTLEFQDHRPLYEWFLDALDLPKPVPEQIEFARLNLSYTVLSKRKLLELVRDGHVDGWDDPRMPTIRGMRRRGIPAAAIRNFCERVGVARRDGVVDVTLFEHSIRSELNATCPRVMGVLEPLKLVITNLDAGETVWLDAPYSPEDESLGSRKVALTRELWVDRNDFRKEAPKKWWRLAPGKEVRLRYGCLVTCDAFEEDEDGNVIELRCTWDPDSKGGAAPDGRRVRGTVHWVSAEHGVPAEVRLYDRLFSVANPSDVPEGKHFTDLMNPDSQTVVQAIVEPSLADADIGHAVQFERVGYFIVDPDSKQDGRSLVFNRTIALRDSWARREKKNKG
jgi:glutaminyl-tRNA synthetase